MAFRIEIAPRAFADLDAITRPAFRPAGPAGKRVRRLESLPHGHWGALGLASAPAAVD